MEEKLIENLHELSIACLNIPLDKSKLQNLAFIEDYYWIVDFLDTAHFPLQKDLLEADEKLIKVILKNFDKALHTNCNNHIDLSQYEYHEKFRFGYKINHNQKRISKKYTISSKWPDDEILFKIYWLKYFIRDLTKIVWNIRYILDLPQPNYPKPINIMHYVEKADAIFNKLSDDTKRVFSSSHSKAEKLDSYFKKVFPVYLHNLDKLFSIIENMFQSFKSQHGYLTDQVDKLKKIKNDLKNKHYHYFENLLNKINLDDKPYILKQINDVIQKLKNNNKINEIHTSEFINIFSDFIIDQQSKNNMQVATSKKTQTKPSHKPTFENSISTENQKFILQLMEDLSITLNGSYNLSARKKSYIKGMVRALIVSGHLPKLAIHTLCVIISNKIGLEINSKLENTTTANDAEKQVKNYIKYNK